MVINKIIKVDDNHIKIDATPGVDEYISAVKVDNQQTFICHNEVSSNAYSLSIPSGETSFIGTNLSLEYSPFNINSDLLFFFIFVKKITETNDYKFYSYQVEDETAQWVDVTDTFDPETTAFEKYRTYDMSDLSCQEEWDTTKNYKLVKVKDVEQDLSDPYIYYNEQSLYELIYNRIKSMINICDCCGNSNQLEARDVILLNAFEIAYRIVRYRDMIRLWNELHLDNSTQSQSCNCHG